MLKYIYQRSFSLLLLGVYPLLANDLKDTSSKTGDQKSEIKEYMAREGQSVEHTTILHGIKSIGKAIAEDADLLVIYDNLITESVEV